MTDFLKLLPYLLLVQRSIEASNGSSMNQEAHDDSSNGDVSSNNNLYESQRKQSAMHLESLRNHIQSSVRCLAKTSAKDSVYSLSCGNRFEILGDLCIHSYIIII